MMSIQTNIVGDPAVENENKELWIINTVFLNQKRSESLQLLYYYVWLLLLLLLVTKPMLTKADSWLFNKSRLC